MIRTHIKKVLREALGVPKNQVETSVEIYKKIMEIIPKNYDIEKLDGFTKKFTGVFEVGDITFNRVNFEIDIEGISGELDLIGIATSEKSRLSNDFKVENLTTGTFNISFRYGVTTETTGEDLIRDMITDKLEYIGSISHELKHFYDNRKIGPTPLKKRIKYETASSGGVSNITPINEFIHYIYYANAIESLVRPSEFAALVKAGEIDKKQFYKFLISTRTYERLNRMKNYSYDILRDGIIEDIQKVKDLFDRVGFDYEGKTDSEIADKTITLIAVNFGNWMGNRLKNKLTTDFIETFLGFRGDKEKYFNKIVKEINKQQENPEKFIKNEIKLMNYVGNNMIKKISKLYDLAK